VLYGFVAVLAISALKRKAQTAKKVLSMARRVMFVAVVLSVITFVLFVFAFLTDNFSIAAVAQHSSESTPLIYKISAAWADSAGSFLLWSVFVFIFFAWWQFSNRKPQLEDDRNRYPVADAQYAISDLDFHAISLTIGAGLCVGFTALLIFMAKPFASNPVVINEGQGLNPVLQNVWMILHPPLSFIGYSAFMIPFVIVLAAVFADRAQDPLVYRQLRRWLLLGICFLTLGITTGARWSYLEVGWDGFWVWDPVQNISLLPLLVAIAALHSLIGMQDVDKFRFWTIALAPLPFILCLFASFVARSELLKSLHSFDMTFVPSALSAFIGCCFLLWLFCVIHAARSISIGPSKATVFHVDKGEVLFWANVVFIFTAVIIGVATFWPLIWEFIIRFDKPFILSADFYNNIASVAGIILVFLLGVAALTDLQKYRNFTIQLLASCAVGLVCFGFMFRFRQEGLVISLACGACAFTFIAVLIKFLLNLKQTSQIAGSIAHFGLLLLVVTVGFTSDRQIIQTVLTEGKRVALGRYELLYESFKQESFGDVIEEGPEIVVTKKPLRKKLWPHKSVYPNGRITDEVAVHTGLFEDVYISFDRMSRGGNVTITAKVKPYMFWLWLSFLLIIVGSFFGFLGKRSSFT